MRNSRKQHTVNVLFHTRLSSEFLKRTGIIKQHFPGILPITCDALETVSAKTTPEKSPMEAVKFMLNYYEFVAAGIRHGDLDNRLVCDCLCTALCTFFDRCEDVIKNARGEDAKGRPVEEKARIFRNLIWLRVKWSRFFHTPRKLTWRTRIARYLCDQ